MINFTLLTEFISPIILLACLCVGYVLKNVIPTESINKWIPLIVGCLGIFLAIWNFGFIDLTVIVTGAISGLAASGLYETFKGLIEGIQDAYNSNRQETETVILDETIEGIGDEKDTHVVVSNISLDNKLATAKHTNSTVNETDYITGETSAQSLEGESPIPSEEKFYTSEDEACG